MGEAGAPVGAAPALIGSATDAIGMFRTSYPYAGRVMSPSATPLVAEVVRTLRRRHSGVKTFVDGFTVVSASNLLNRLADCRMRVAQLESSAIDPPARVATGRAGVVRAEAEVAELRAAILEVVKKSPVPPA